METKLRIKIKLGSDRLQWMFCDLNKVKSIKDLGKEIKKRFNCKKIQLLLDDAILPRNESIELLNNGDVITVQDEATAKLNNGHSVIEVQRAIKASSSEADEEKIEAFEKPFAANPLLHGKKRSSDDEAFEKPPKKPLAAKESSSDEEQVKQRKKRKRRKNKNKNKLAVQEKPTEEPVPVIKPAQKGYRRVIR